MVSRRLIMRADSRKEEQPTEPRKEVSERPRRFRIVKLEERIAPGGGIGNGYSRNAPCHTIDGRRCR
jgi:hypothetical protein